MSNMDFIDGNETYKRLLSLETNGRSAPDMRRVMSGERQSLHVALASGDPGRIAAAEAEANWVISMWTDDAQTWIG